MCGATITLISKLIDEESTSNQEIQYQKVKPSVIEFPIPMKGEIKIQYQSTSF